MINGIGSTGGGGRIDGARAQSTQSAGAPGRVAAKEEGAPPSPAAELAASGPPVDTAKVAEIRTAIAEGRYSVDPRAIASKMIALDLPGKA